jgi:hypothetical protein
MTKLKKKTITKKGDRDEVSRRDRKISSRSRRFAESERDNKKSKAGARKPTIRETITDKSRGSVVVSLRREKQKFSRDARLTLTEAEVDPVRMLALLVAGDVVGLGLMSEEEYNKKPIYDEDGNIEEPGGRELAAELLGISSRQQAARDLLPYLYSKPQDPAPKPQGDDTNRAVIYLPENGRTYNANGSAI